MYRKKKERRFLFSTLLIQDIAFNDVNCLKRYIFQWYFSPHENKYATRAYDFSRPSSLCTTGTIIILQSSWWWIFVTICGSILFCLLVLFALNFHFLRGWPIRHSYEGIFLQFTIWNFSINPLLRKRTKLITTVGVKIRGCNCWIDDLYKKKKRFNYLDHFWFLKFVFFTPKASLRKFYSVYRKILLIKYMNRSWSADTHTRKKKQNNNNNDNNNKKQENLLFFSNSPINQIYLLPDVIYTPTPECVISILQHLQNIYCGHLFAQK